MTPADSSSPTLSELVSKTPNSSVSKNGDSLPDRRLSTLDAEDSSQTSALLKKVRANWKRHPPSRLFGDAASGGALYRWGWATAAGSAIPGTIDRLARLAAMRFDEDPSPATALPESARGEPGSGAPTEDWELAALAWLDSPRVERTDPVAAMQCVLWAAALPALANRVSMTTWWHLLEELQLRRAACDDDPATAVACRLIGAGELGLTLAWRLAAFPSCQRLAEAAVANVTGFFINEDLSVDGVLQRPHELRLVLGSVIRCEAMMRRIAKRKFNQDDRDMAFELASWAAAMTRHDGTSAWSTLRCDEVRDDFADGGLFSSATRYDEESLRPAFAASLGQGHTGGRLAWEVSLPETMWNLEEAGTAVMLPEWDVRRGRTFVDYRGLSVKIEIMGGRCLVFRGEVGSTVSVGGVVQTPMADWQNTCEFTDDDVHYLELEQAHTGGVVLQRQFMVIRDDRCVLIADAVLPGEQRAADDAPIVCVTRLPLDAAVIATPESETREVMLSVRKRRALAMPLAGSEWRVGASDSHLDVATSDGEPPALVLTTRGRGAVYSPLWLDFQARRFRRKRTWRQLTVADQLQRVPRHEAAGFRVQVGSEHWIVYRSMRGLLPRSFLGRHLAADFFAARFHPGDGGMEELVTVDNTEE